MSDLAPAGALGAAWRWWTGELKGLVPRRFGRGAPRRRKAVVLSKFGDGLTIELRDDGKSETIATLPPNAGPADLAPYFARIESAQRKGYALGYHLSPEKALTRTLGLPSVAEDDLRAVVRHQIDLVAPFPVERVSFDHAVIGRDYRTGMLETRIVIVPRKVIDSAVASLKALDLSPDYIDVEGPRWGELNLLPVPAAEKTRRSSRLNVWLLAANLVLLCLVVGLPILRWSLVEQELEQRLELAAAESRVVRALQDKIDTLEAEHDFFVEHQAAAQAPLLVLNELSTALPDDTWLEALQLRPGEATLSGQSKSAADLIPILQQSPLFEDVAFDAPIVKDDKTQREKFRIRLSIPHGGS